MPTNDEIPKKKAELSWSARQAVAILAVDNIKTSEATKDLMRRIDAGEITTAQAIESIVAKGKALAKAQQK